MTILTKNDIINAKDLEIERVVVKEWGGAVAVRGMTAKERDDFEHEMFNQIENKSTKTVRAKLVCRCCVDENGDRIFKDEDYIMLEKKNGRVVDKIFKVAQRLSGLTGKEVEDLAKNS